MMGRVLTAERSEAFELAEVIDEGLKVICPCARCVSEGRVSRRGVAEALLTTRSYPVPQ